MSIKGQIAKVRGSPDDVKKKHGSSDNCEKGNLCRSLVRKITLCDVVASRLLIGQALGGRGQAEYGAEERKSASPDTNELRLPSE